jgi:hypothetical protein
MFTELRRVPAFAIWNETIPVGDAEAPVVTAKRFCIDAGQNHDVPEQTAIAESGNKNRFEPLSIKLFR